jgi:hypothetical protein
VGFCARVLFSCQYPQASGKQFKLLGHDQLKSLGEQLEIRWLPDRSIKLLVAINGLVLPLQYSE